MKFKNISYELFHGTNSKNVSSIVNNGFIKKPDPQDWLGHGVYFFIEGVSCPSENSLGWAVNRIENDHPESVSVIKAFVTVSEEKILNLTTLDGLRKYNYTRDFVIEKFESKLKYRRDLKIKKRKDFRIDDQIIMNAVIDILNVDIVISNLYIKNKTQRSLELESCLPNSTVASVINTAIIDHSRIIEVTRHEVFKIT